MKRTIFLSLTALVLSLNINAQNADRKARIEAFKAQRVAYITEKINLSSAEAQKLWPLYNEWKQKELELGKSRASYLEVSPKTENDYDKATKAYIELDARKAELAEEYNQKLRAILSAEKLFGLYVAEWEFQKQAIRKRGK